MNDNFFDIKNDNNHLVDHIDVENNSFLLLSDHRNDFESQPKLNSMGENGLQNGQKSEPICNEICGLDGNQIFVEYSINSG